MEISVTVIVCSLLYSTLLCIVYFSKKHIDSAENKIYGHLMKMNIFGLTLELLCSMVLYNKDVSEIFTFLNILVNKTFLIYLLAWELVFTAYMIFISFGKTDKFKKIMKEKSKSITTSLIVISFILIILISFLPLYYVNDGNYLYSYGPATNVLFILGGICILIDTYCLIKNFKKVTTKKYYPLFILVFLMGLVYIIRSINPGLTIINSVFAFTTILMYFTIENPDLQMVDELVKNRALVESSMEDKSAFLFKMSQEIKLPVKRMSDEIKYYHNNKMTKKEIDQCIDKMEDSIKNLTFIINDVLNVSTMDVSKIKVIDTSYNTFNFFDNIKLMTASKINNKPNLKLNYSISNNLPEVLMGDYIKLKQALVAILYNAVEHTQNGYVDFEIESINRYDVCRLLLTVKDSGEGMPLELVNSLLSKENQFTDVEFKKLNELDVDLKVAIKLIRVLGGNINIRSNEESGTEILITIDQKINQKENKSNEILKKYENSMLADKKVLVVDDDTDEINKIVNYLSHKDVTSNFVMYGGECVARIKTGEKYSLIIMDDEMMPDNALPTFQKLKELKKFNVPVVVMLNKEKEFIKKHYIDDGFSDYLLKNNFDSELKRITDKYL